MTARTAVGALALSLVAAACVDSTDDPSATPTTDLSGEEIELTAALVTVADCDALLNRIKDEAIERVGPYGFSQGFYPEIAFGLEEDAVDMAMEDGDDAAFDTAESAVAPESSSARTSGDRASVEAADESAEGGQEFSETNNQEEGVDEADLVKTDGNRLVTVNGNRLRVVDVTGDRPQLTSTVKLPDEFWGGELFLDGDTALLMTTGWTPQPLMERGETVDWYGGSPTGRIMEIDLATGTIERTLEFEGSYLSAREIDGSIRIVMTATAQRFNFVFPSSRGAEDTAERANRDLIENSTIDMWIPTYRITDGAPGQGDVVEDGPIVDCDQVHLPTEFAGFGSLVVLTADISEGLTISDSLSVFTEGNTVYASPDRLAVATPKWPEWTEDGELVNAETYRTAIHSFDISDPASTNYAASGSVRGFLLNQYSLSEYDGYLRVATTDGIPWNSRTSESFVTVLGEDGGDLVEVGQVGGLGPGEQIFAVRFLGEMAYVVTFEQIDPLYTIDLSDPTNPRAVGELKIPGVSDYLHPYGDFLVAVGRDGDENGLNGGSVVSLFDVSDNEDPRLVAKVPIGPRPDREGQWIDTSSPVAWDARAFTMWGDTAIVPVSWWSWDDTGEFGGETNGSAIELVRVDDDSGQLTNLGRVSHPVVSECEGGFFPTEEGVIVERAEESAEAAAEEAAVETTEDAEAEFVTEEAPPALEDDAIDSAEEWCWSYQPEIRRSVIVGDNLFTISENGIAVNNFESLDNVTWIPFEA
jgi:hypothetical protein